MKAIDANTIVTIHLKYSSSAKPLKILAFAQLAAKILFLSDAALDLSTITTRTGKALGVKNLSKNLINEGLQFLLGQGTVSLHEKQWSLEPSARAQISSQSDDWQKLIDGVLARHFPTVAEPKIIREWFNEASASIFGHFGDDWVASASKGGKHRPPPRRTFAQLTAASTGKHQLTKHSQALVDGYLGFLNSDDDADLRCVMGLGYALFSARLVAADVGTDPLTLDEFREARILVDTNVLFAIAVGGRRINRSLSALAGALKTLGASLCYIRQTSNEYERALAAERALVMSLVRTFPEELVADSDDEFVRAAKLRGATTEEDYERFFTSIAEVPKTLDGTIAIALYENPEVEKAVEQGAADAGLKGKLRSVYVELHPERQKTDAAAKHDAGLMHVVEAERLLGEKTWVLSLDRSLRLCASQRAGAYNVPTVISVEALIEILAVYGPGPGVESGDYGPLLARMILNQCEPVSGSFGTQDLRWLSNMREAMAGLKPEQQKDIAMVVARARISGKKVDDRNLQLQVQRLSEEKRQEGEHEVRDMRDRVKVAEEQVATETGARLATEERLVDLQADVVRRRLKTELVRELAWRVPAAAGISFVLWAGSTYAIAKGDTGAAINYILAAIGLFGSGWKLVPTAVSRYRQQSREAVRIARAELALRGSNTEDIQGR